ncbi:MAG: aminoglycoside phosphotransferase family protein [Actinomycetota bacterium]|nr:aminoglycoside phosphotransferase family protein [Actinomycetota bacterium]
MRQTHESLTAEIVDRRPLGAGGASGNKLERVTLRDGRELVLKRVSPQWDWISRATNDRGRIVSMWTDGIIERLPPVIDHATVAVEAGDDGSWSVFMTDVSDVLMHDGEQLDRARLERLVGALAALHATFWEESFPALCSLEERYNLLSPETGRREAEEGDTWVGNTIAGCWELFPKLVPADIGDAILKLAEQPQPLADELRKCSQTLVHGDVRLANLGFTDERVVLVDWGERTGTAPAAVDLASFLVFEGSVIHAPYDDVIELFRAYSGDRHDERALQLALIGGLVQLGPNFALEIVIARDEAKRAAAQAASETALSWWIPTIDKALQAWSPI